MNETLNRFSGSSVGAVSFPIKTQLLLFKAKKFTTAISFCPSASVTVALKLIMPFTSVALGYISPITGNTFVTVNSNVSSSVLFPASIANTFTIFDPAVHPLVSISHGSTKVILLPSFTE